MKKLFLFLLLALLVSICAAADYSQGAEIINGTVIKATPTLDGVLDDAYLDSLCVKLNPPSYVGAETDVFATVYSLYDDGFVYVFFNVENDTTLMSADPSYIARDSHPSLNDAVEVRISDNGAGKLPEYTGTNNHHLIIADPFGLRCSAYESTLGNRTALLSSASKITSETSYTVELRIPLKAPLEESDVLQFNFQVDDLQDTDGTTGYIGLSSSYWELNSFSVDASTHYPTVAPTVSHVEFTPPIHNQRFLFSRPNSTTGMSFIVHYLDGTSVDVTDEVVLDKTEFTSVGYTLVNAVWKDLKAPFLAEVHYARGYEAGYTWQVYSHGTLYVTGEIPNFTEAAPSPWSEYSEYITSLQPAPEVTVIGDRAFAGCYKLEKARIPDSVAYIGADAFADCPRLVIYADKNTVAREYALKNNLVEYSYNAWGEVTSTGGTLAHINPFRYKSYYYDSDIKMYYCKSRYYVPLWKRWLNADSPKYLDNKDTNNLNLFVYCGNDPISNLDAGGNAWYHWAVATVFALAIVATAVCTAGAIIAAAPVVASYASTVAIAYTGSVALGSVISTAVSVGAGILAAGTIAVGINEGVASLTGVNYGEELLGEDLYEGVSTTIELLGLSYIYCGANMAYLSRGDNCSNLKEQLALEEAECNPTNGRVINMKEPMKDPRTPHWLGWEKYAYNIEGVEVHYVGNKFFPKWYPFSPWYDFKVK